MSDTERRNFKNLLFWLSAKPNGKDKYFIQVGESLLRSKEFQNLNSGAQILYLAMAAEARRSETFEFTEYTAAKYGISRNTLRRRAPELKKHGFIEYDSAKSTRTKNKYRFSKAWKAAPP